MMKGFDCFQAIGLALLVTLLSAAPGAAFYCYVPEKPGSPFALRERPSAQARIVGLMEPGHMMRSVARTRERNGWALVDWFKDQSSKKPLGRGWVYIEEIHGGECED